jgi:uncharacterized protein
LRLCGLHRRARRNARAIAVRHHDFLLAGLPDAFHNFTMLHLSDLHLDMHPAMPAALIERLQTVEYDISVLTGDVRAKTFGPAAPAVMALQHVRAHLKWCLPVTGRCFTWLALMTRTITAPII